MERTSRRNRPLRAHARDEPDKGVGQVIGELKELTIDYARQETVDPLKALGRFTAFGVAGSLFIGIGVILLALAVLRALQTETGSTFTGNWSWAPYLICLAAVGLVAGISASAIGADKRRREKAKARS